MSLTCTYGPVTLDPGCPTGCPVVLMMGVATTCDLGAAMLATVAAPLGIWYPRWGGADVAALLEVAEPGG